jgi:hypothetical protein
MYKGNGEMTQQLIPLCLEIQDKLISFTSFNLASRPRVLIMSYNTFRLHKEEVYASKVDLVICDEVGPYSTK